jgi:hypothetical protein
VGGHDGSELITARKWPIELPLPVLERSSGLYGKRHLNLKGVRHALTMGNSPLKLEPEYPDFGAVKSSSRTVRSPTQAAIFLSPKQMDQTLAVQPGRELLSQAPKDRAEIPAEFSA